MNLKHIEYLRSYQVIRALIIYQLIYQNFKNYHHRKARKGRDEGNPDFFYLAACFYSCAIDNESILEMGSAEISTKSKTASRRKIKKSQSTPSMKDPESLNSIRFGGHSTGNLHQGLHFDKNGNLTQKSTQKMYHDYRNQMVRVTEGTTTTENKYDALGRRLQMIVNTGSQTKTENYYYSGHQVIEVRDGSDQVKRQFIYGNGIDEVIRMDVYNGSTFTPYYFHSNAIGSTTALTDANGQVVERYKYGLFGIPTFMDAAGNVIPGSTIGNNILFQGREYEPETNFYFFRARHYDPIMGRFLQTDPMGYEDSLNLYQSFNMNPVNFVDPWGLSLKLSQDEMCKFEENLYNILYALYDKHFDAETADMLKDWLIKHATLENMVWAFNELTGLGLEMPDKLTVFDKIFGAAKSYANYSKKVGDRVRKFLGSEEAQQIIDNRKDHWLVQEGVTSHGHITITQQLNLAYAKGYGKLAELGTEELQWAIVAGVAGKLKYIDELVDAKRARKYSRRNLTGVAKRARWSKTKQGVRGPGLRHHFDDHGWQVGARSVKEYDLSARITIQRGRRFKYRVRGTNEYRVGYWDPETELFTATSQYRKVPIIHSHYPLSLEEVKGLPGFTWY